MVTTGYMMTAIVEHIFPGNPTPPNPVRLRKQSHVCVPALRRSSPASPPSSHFLPSITHFLCPKVYTVVDEMFLAGEIRETSQTKVLKQLLMLQSLE